MRDVRISRRGEGSREKAASNDGPSNLSQPFPRGHESIANMIFRYVPLFPPQPLFPLGGPPPSLSLYPLPTEHPSPLHLTSPQPSPQPSPPYTSSLPPPVHASQLTQKKSLQEPQAPPPRGPRPSSHRLGRRRPLALGPRGRALLRADGGGGGEAGGDAAEGHDC